MRITIEKSDGRKTVIETRENPPELSKQLLEMYLRDSIGTFSPGRTSHSWPSDLPSKGLVTLLGELGQHQQVCQHSQVLLWQAAGL